MIFSFELSMPNNNSWNGRWSGQGNLYVRVRNISKAQATKITKENYSYNFGDGWRALIKVKHVDSKEAAKLRRNSKGFFGYEWMIDEIIKYGKILNVKQSES